MRSFFYNLDKTISDAEVNRKYDLRDFCYEVRGFVLEGTFTKYKKVKTIMGYWSYPDTYVSKMTGMAESTVRVTRRNLSEELYGLFGYDFFQVISIGDEKAITEGKGRLLLARRGYNASEYLSQDLILAISSKSKIDDTIDVKSCASEIQFLVRHSKQTIEEEISHLDVNKLGYLIRMLNNETGSLTDIQKLIKCFDKEAFKK